jgi:hypothetical protein
VMLFTKTVSVQGANKFSEWMQFYGHFMAQNPNRFLHRKAIFFVCFRKYKKKEQKWIDFCGASQFSPQRQTSAPEMWKNRTEVVKFPKAILSHWVIKLVSF